MLPFLHSFFDCLTSKVTYFLAFGGYTVGFLINILFLKYGIWQMNSPPSLHLTCLLFSLSCRREASKDKQSESHPESIDHNNKYSGYFLSDILFRMSSSLRMRILGTEPSSEKMSGI
jgi:hypothetical protein